ncbi:hypothetical protein GGX14DRAFT_573850 [Mycena pura]|uniref:Uncharacterized protein n=1 Tax=Mycena pura TaxID=153505 RepID=A0AAD6V5U0_9AGAR|nr:hypothetical protein GGX14DRAFT_573850 [Mycena pura]
MRETERLADVCTGAERRFRPTRADQKIDMVTDPLQPRLLFPPPPPSRPSAPTADRRACSRGGYCYQHRLGSGMYSETSWAASGYGGYDALGWETAGGSMSNGSGFEAPRPLAASMPSTPVWPGNPAPAPVWNNVPANFRPPPPPYHPDHDASFLGLQTYAQAHTIPGPSASHLHLVEPINYLPQNHSQQPENPRFERRLAHFDSLGDYLTTNETAPIHRARPRLPPNI